MKIFYTHKFGYGLLAGAAALAVTAVGAPSMASAAYPEKPITVVIGWGPGGGIDSFCRVVKKYSEKYLGVDLKLVYKPGGAGTVAHNLLVRNLPKDGYTLAAANIPNQVIPPNLSKKGYRLDQIKWVANFSLVPSAVLVKRDGPYKTFADLVAAAKKNPGKLKAGAPGATSGAAAFHYGWSKMSGAPITLVPYRGGSKTYQGLLGGEVEVMSANMNWGVRYKDTLRVLAAASPKRYPFLKDAPTFKEQGIDFVDFLSRSLTASKEVSDKKIATLGKLFRKLAEDKDFEKDFGKVGLTVDYMDGKETAKYVDGYVKQSQDVFAMMSKMITKKK
jgi:tripartite-type tricarboxylate transporter receptor subunit TctC